ncbi:magnesium transporter CorA family protein [Patescibacteria group bacterium]
MRIITSNNITWIDIKNPKQKNLDELNEKIKLHPMIKRQFLPPIHRPKIEEYLNQIFIVLHFPVYNIKKRENNPVELDIIITPDMLITSHSEEIPSLDIFFNDCEHQKYHQKHYFKTSNHLALGMLDWIIDECLPMLDHISEEAINIEKNVFEGNCKEMLTEISIVKRNLINFRRAIKPQRSILEVLEKKYRRLYGKELKTLTQEVVGSNIRVWNILENNQELINSLEQTNNSLVSYKLNDIMRFLTVISFITFPLSVIVGFFGMNIFSNIPIVNSPIAWIVITIVMIISTIIMVAYFKNKKWL